VDAPGSGVQLLQPDGDTAHGLRQSGPRPVFALGTLIIAAGPALWSNGVGFVTSKPQGLAVAGLLNQKPMWNVLVGCRSTSGSKPKIWSMIENSDVVALPFPNDAAGAQHCLRRKECVERLVLPERTQRLN
jgi:hypothetical protein